MFQCLWCSVQQEEQEEEEEIEEVYVPYTPPVAKPWHSLGSEVEIDEESVIESRKKVGLLLKLMWNVSNVLLLLCGFVKLFFVLMLTFVPQ